MRAWSSARFTVPLPDGHRFPIAKYARIRDEVADPRPPARPHDRGARPGRPVGARAGAHAPYVRRGARRHPHASGGSPAGLPLELRTCGSGRSERCKARSRPRSDALETGSASTSPAAPTTPSPAMAKDSASSTTWPSRSACSSGKAGSSGRRSWTWTCTRETAPHTSSPTTPTSSPSRCTGHETYPFRKERSALDVELEDGCEDAAYLAALDAHLGRCSTLPGRSSCSTWAAPIRSCTTGSVGWA